MSIDPAPHRKSIRLRDFDYSQPGAYFVTIVTHHRALLFGRIMEGEVQLSRRGKIARACWQEIPQHFPQTELGAFVLVPNHVHGILVLHDVAASNPSSSPVGAADQPPPVGAQHAAPLPAAPRGPHVVPGSLSAIVRSYKAAVTHRIVQEFGPLPRVWQRNYYEHVIRNADEWNRIHLYIEANPAAWDRDDENPVNVRGPNG